MIVLAVYNAMMFSAKRNNIKPKFFFISFIVMVFHSAFTITIVYFGTELGTSLWKSTILNGMINGLPGFALVCLVMGIFFIGALALFGIIVSFFCGLAVLSSSISSSLSIMAFSIFCVTEPLFHLGLQAFLARITQTIFGTFQLAKFTYIFKGVALWTIFHYNLLRVLYPIYGIITSLFWHFNCLVGNGLPETDLDGVNV